MKKIKFLAVAFVALTIVSCTENGTTGGNDNIIPEGRAEIEISFTSASNTRAANAAIDIADQVINDASIFVFRATGLPDVARKYVGTITLQGATGTEIIDATTSATTVYVVTNLGTAAEHNTIFAGVSNEAQLKALVKGRIVDLSSIVATDVLMTGVGTISGYTEGATDTDPSTATVSVNLKFPLAKIQLKVDDLRTKNQLAAAVTATKPISIVDNAVVLLSAGKEIKFFDLAQGGSDQAVQTTFYTGDNSYAGFTGPATLNATVFSTPSGTFGTTVGQPVTHHFYTSANDGATKPTILAIKSTKTVHGTPNVVTSTYYPIQFTAKDAKHTLLAGNSYTVHLTINGDVQAGEGGGTENPDTEILPASITATITVAAWTAVPISKEFE